MPAPTRKISPLGTIVGGTVGGVVGVFLGAFVAEGISKGCQGEDCGLLNAILGVGIGEALGVGIGAHVGSGSHELDRLLLTSLTSVGILVGGTVVGAGLSHAGVGAIMIPLTPALQLAAALAIESR